MFRFVFWIHLIFFFWIIYDQFLFLVHTGGKIIEKFSENIKTVFHRVYINQFYKKIIEGSGL